MDGFVEVSQKEMMEVDGGGKAVSAVTAVVCAAAAKVCLGRPNALQKNVSPFTASIP